jgi:hypothetical protein
LKTARDSGRLGDSDHSEEKKTETKPETDTESKLLKMVDRISQ